jgi:hypothetical protein
MNYIHVIPPSGRTSSVLNLSLKFSQQQKTSNQKEAAAKVFIRKKWLIIGVQLDFLEARLRPVEQLDKEVELGCRSSGMCH